MTWQRTFVRSFSCKLIGIEVGRGQRIQNPMSVNDPSTFRKSLVKDTATTIGKLVACCNDEKYTQTLEQIAEQLPPLLEQQQLLTKSQRELSGVIGKARKRGEDVQPLMRSSGEISAKLKLLNNQISTFSDEALSIHQAVSAPTQIDVLDSTIQVGPIHFLPIPVVHNQDANSIKVTLTDDAGRWNDYVSGSDHATHYHRYEWRHVIERNFPQKCYYLVAHNSDGETIGVAASVHMKSKVFGSFMLSMPFLIYGGPVANNQLIGDVLASHTSELADQNNCTHTELRERQAREGWYSKTDKVSMVLDLPDTKDSLNSGLGSKLLAQVRRAVREEPEFVLGGGELIPEFYAVFSRKMRDLGTPVFAMDFFQDMARTFPESTHVAVVRLNGQPVSAAFLISFKDTLEIPWAASVRKFDRLGMNMFMYHSLLQYAVHNNFRYFDFGRSTRGESTWTFKKQWGATERVLHLHFMADGVPFNPGPGNASAKFTVAVAIWKRLPLWFTNRLGPIIARQLPW